MAPKRVHSEMLMGDHTPTGSPGEKKKDDTTPTPVVDKDVTPSEDDKKKKDSSSNRKKDSTTEHTQLTELTELSPHSPFVGASKKKDQERRSKAATDKGSKKRVRREQVNFNKKLKHLRKTQSKKLKHPRSLSQNIMRILRSVNESQEQEALPHKRVNQLSMMIFDSFANDLCDKLCATGVELVRNANKRQLGSAEIKAAMKLVLPHDMATCAEEAVVVSLTSYRESTKKFQGKIGTAKGIKKAAAGKKD